MFKKIGMLSLAALVLSHLPVAAQDLSSMTWYKIVAQAKTEGELTWFHWYPKRPFVMKSKRSKASTE